MRVLSKSVPASNRVTLPMMSANNRACEILRRSSRYTTAAPCARRHAEIITPGAAIEGVTGDVVAASEGAGSEGYRLTLDQVEERLS